MGVDDTNSDMSILLTGAGGSIGSALATAITASDPRLLVLLDHSESNLHRIESELSTLGSAEHVPILGDVGDPALLADIFDRYRPDIVYHAAAFKHVPLMEANPVATVRNNAIGTFNLAKAANEYQLPRLIMISTDKAVNPLSVMGASKRVAELALLRWSNTRSPMKVLRLGNVLGSEGSVVPLFREQISRGGPVTVTHPEVSRYFLTMADAVRLVLAMDTLEAGGGIFVPEMKEPVKIVDLARNLIRAAGLQPEQDIKIEFTGLRPGDKMAEELVSANEYAKASSVSGIHRVIGPEVLPRSFDNLMKELEDGCARRDPAKVLEALCKLVPEYRPSELVVSLSRSPVGAKI